MKQVQVSIAAFMTILLAFQSNESRAQDCETGTFDGGLENQVIIPQNWSCAERQQFWFTDQGSQIIPYVWFLHLEQAQNQSKFSDHENMDRYGYLPQKATTLNNDGLPIGFTKGNAKANKPYRRISNRWLGMTCAACHTGQVEFKGAKFLIDGAPTMGDFERMLIGLVEAMQATLKDDAKFNRFADAVITDSKKRGIGGATTKTKLRRQLKKVTEIRRTWNMRNRGSNVSGRYGPGRLDALGAIYNETAATGLGVPANIKAADAPVSYPFLWDTPQHDKVQWNGSITNARLGSLSRNVGEVLGVFGALELDFGKPLLGPLDEALDDLVSVLSGVFGDSKNKIDELLRLKLGHKTSVDVGALAKLESLLWRVQSPRWSDTTLPPTKPSLVEEGRGIFKELCASCHPVINRSDSARKIVAKMDPVFNPANPGDPSALRTDVTMARNFLERTAQARKLTGRFTRYLGILSDGERFKKENRDKTRQIKIVAYSVAGTIVREFLTNPDDVIAALKAGQPKNAKIRNLEQLRTKAGELKVKAMSRMLKEVDDRLSDYINTAQTLSCFPDGILPCYKARPLNGIWATAPYLHNGSVRTMRQLLQPAAMRQKSFNVGSREYVPADMGFRDGGEFTLDTTKPGNSNSGHEGPAYGTEQLIGKPKMMNALLEYLKTL